LRAAGLVPLTTTDFPGRLAAAVFCQGCPWTCGYCQNPHLIPAAGEDRIEWPEIRSFLERRRGLLDGVVFSGGEPTLQRGLEEAMREVRALGFEVGLHTGGAYPGKLRRLLPLTDWVGLDVKAGFDEYEKVTGVPRSGERARRSLEYLLESGVSHEVRTTVHPLLFDDESLLRLARDLARRGVRNYAVQKFRAQGCANEIYRAQPGNEFPYQAVENRIGGLFERFQVRDS
jgi:pyruvate formate lyase activating enzyme